MRKSVARRPRHHLSRPAARAAGRTALGQTGVGADLAAAPSLKKKEKKMVAVTSSQHFLGAHSGNVMSVLPLRADPEVGAPGPPGPPDREQEGPKPLHCPAPSALPRGTSTPSPLPAGLAARPLAGCGLHTNCRQWPLGSVAPAWPLGTARHRPHSLLYPSVCLTRA